MGFFLCRKRQIPESEIMGNMSLGIGALNTGMLFMRANPGGGGLLKYDLGRACRWDLKSRPIFIPNFAEKWDPYLYTTATNFKQNLLKMSHYFPKLFVFQANFGNFGIRLMKLGLFSRQFKKILKIWPMFIPDFALNKGSSLYQEADFDIHFSGTSRIDLCTKNPPPGS